MVKILPPVLALLAAFASHASTLQATLDKPRAALGEAIQLTIKANDIDLSKLDLAPLMQDFEVFSQAASRGETRGRIQSQLDVTLYPLRSGQLILPALQFSAWQSKPLALEVTGGSGEVPSVGIRAWIKPEQPMEREAATLYLEIEDDGSLQWTPPTKIDAGHALITAQGETVHETQHDGVRRVTHAFRWRVLPLKPDNLTLRLPMLDAHKFGQRLRFAAPTVSLRARAAPAHLPLHLPIGRPKAQVTLPVLLSKGQPATWQIDLDAPGLSAEGAAKLLTLPDREDVTFYPPHFAVVSESGRSWLRGTLHFVPSDGGELVIAPLALPYFDPTSQRLLSLPIDAPHGVVRDPLREKIETVMRVLSGLALLFWIGRHTLRWALLQRRKRAWLRQIRGADNAPALYLALLHNEPTARSLRTWAKRHDLAQEWVDALERRRFGPASEIEWDVLKAAWHTQAAHLPLRCFT